MAVSLGRFPKVLPKLEKVSRRHGMVSLVNAVFFVTVLPHSEKSVERCIKTSLQEHRARSPMFISPGDYGRGKGNTIRGIPEIIVG
jgi:hypothetical protein